MDAWMRDARIFSVHLRFITSSDTNQHEATAAARTFRKQRVLSGLKNPKKGKLPWIMGWQLCNPGGRERMMAKALNCSIRWLSFLLALSVRLGSAAWSDGGFGWGWLMHGVLQSWFLLPIEYHHLLIKNLACLVACVWTV
jgi:hypothetical protein